MLLCLEDKFTCTYVNKFQLIVIGVPFSLHITGKCVNHFWKQALHFSHLCTAEIAFKECYILHLYSTLECKDLRLVRKKHNEALKMHDFTFIIRLNMVWVISLESLVSYLEFGEWVHVWRRWVQSWERSKIDTKHDMFFFPFNLDDND